MPHASSSAKYQTSTFPIYQSCPSVMKENLLFKGRLKNGLKEGFCLTVDTDGNTYRGFFQSDKKQGFGISD